MMKQLSGEAFIKAMQGETVFDVDGVSVSFLKEEVEEIEIGDDVFDGEIYNVVNIENVFVRGNVEICEDSRFSYPITIQKGHFDFFKIEGGLFEDYLVFKDVSLRTLDIYGGEFEGNLKFEGVKVQHRINILGGEYKENVSLECESDFQYSSEIKGGKFYKWVFFYGGSFHIDGGHFLDSIIFDRGRFNNLMIHGGEFHEEIIIQGGDYGYFQIFGGVFYNGFDLRDADIECFVVDGGEFQNTLKIGNARYAEIILNKGRFITIEICSKESYIDELLINMDTHCEIRISKSSINRLTLSNNLRSDGRISIKRTSINEWKFENFENEGKIFIADIIAKNINKKNENTYTSGKGIGPSKLSIINCDMGNSSFFNTDFESFDNIIINSSRLNDVKTLNKHIPTSQEKNIFTDEKYECYRETRESLIKKNAKFKKLDIEGYLYVYEEDNKYLAELYNQLYLTMQKQGNTTQEVKYYIDYLEYLRKSNVDNLKSGNGFLKKIFKQNWHTPLSLWVYKYTSNYGTNWLRSILLIVIFGVFFYILYAYSIGYKYFDINYLGFHFKNLIEFILPTHKIEFIEHSQPNGWSALWDILGRILIGYLIYQTIVVFRRFGKK